MTVNKGKSTPINRLRSIRCIAENCLFRILFEMWSTQINSLKIRFRCCFSVLIFVILNVEFIFLFFSLFISARTESRMQWMWNFSMIQTNEIGRKEYASIVCSLSYWKPSLDNIIIHLHNALDVLCTHSPFLFFCSSNKIVMYIIHIRKSYGFCLTQM